MLRFDRKQQNSVKQLSFNKKKLIKKLKRQLTEWKKICANHISDKEPVSGIYEELLYFNNKKINTLV